MRRVVPTFSPTPDVSRLGPPRYAVVALSADQLSGDLVGLLAVVHGDPTVVERARRLLERTVPAEWRSDNPPRGREGEALAAVLRHIAEEVPTGLQPLSIMAAILIRREAIIASLGSGRAALCAEDGVRTVAIGTGGTAESVHLTRVPVEPGDFLVLLGDHATHNLDDQDLLEASQGALAEEDFEAWLRALAESRGIGDAEVAVTEVPERGISWGVLGNRTVILAALAPALVVAAVGVALLTRGAHAPAAPLAPVGLRAGNVTQSGASLSWQPIDRATGYAVSLGSYQFTAGSAHLRIGAPLQPGATYRWQVRARLSGGFGPASQPAVLQVPPGTLPSIRPVAPLGTYHLAGARSLDFCWRTAHSGQQFELVLYGPKLHVKEQPRSIQWTRAVRACTTMTLRQTGLYAWYVGAARPGYTSHYSPWAHFSLVPVSQHRPAPTVHTPRSSPPAVAAAPPRQAVPTAAPAPTYVAPTPRPAPVSQAPQPVQPVYHPPTVAPRPAPVAPAPVATVPVKPAPAPTAPVLSCPTPPNCS